MCFRLFCKGRRKEESDVDVLVEFGGRQKDLVTTLWSWSSFLESCLKKRFT
ncbi:MAG: hypothetical protein Q6362_006855 [Candidatus Wukongarchaeota archaeon]|nr:hypothetical protein [Candidatus Wukongarchaeota archaeon]